MNLLSEESVYQNLIFYRVLFPRLPELLIHIRLFTLERNGMDKHPMMLSCALPLPPIVRINLIRYNSMGLPGDGGRNREASPGADFNLNDFEFTKGEWSFFIVAKCIVEALNPSHSNVDSHLAERVETRVLVSLRGEN